MREMMNSLIKQKIKETGLFPKKKLGQHFLISPFLIQKMVSAIKNLKPTEIIEIGPGWGALTTQLIPLKTPLRVVELDPAFAQYWRDRQITVLEGSALKILWQQGMDLKASSPILRSGTVLVGNLPYNIGSRLLVQLCPAPPQIQAMVLMFQKEVAQRILSPPKCKNYGILSVLSQYFWQVHLLLTAGVSDFYPRPKVAGQVLVFGRKKRAMAHPDRFLAFIKFCFAQRRKVLLSRLCREQKIKKSQTGTKDFSIAYLFDQMGLSHSLRAEELSPAQFAHLFLELEKNQPLKVS